MYEIRGARDIRMSHERGMLRHAVDYVCQGKKDGWYSSNDRQEKKRVHGIAGAVIFKTIHAVKATVKLERLWYCGDDRAQSHASWAYISPKVQEFD